jgi:hypothetical protein
MMPQQQEDSQAAGEQSKKYRLFLMFESKTSKVPDLITKSLTNTNIKLAGDVYLVAKLHSDPCGFGSAPLILQ